MYRRIISDKRKVSRRVAAGIVVLTFLSLALMIATTWLFIGLSDSSSAVARSIREDAVWAAFQADREASRLVEAAIESNQTGELGDLQMRFDLLYSRLGLLRSGKYGITFGAPSGVGGKADAVVALVLRLTGDMDALARSPETFQAQAPDLLRQARAIRNATGDLIVSTNAAVGELRVAERDQALDTYLHIGLAVAALLVVLILIVCLLALQLRHISQTGREMEQLNEKYAKSAHDAEAASRAKSAFLATMSHEIRTPLNAIIGMADLMRETSMPAEQGSQLAIIRQAGDILLDVINDVLDYSKLEAGAVTIDQRCVPLPDLTGSVGAIMSPRAEAAGLAFVISAPLLNVTVDAARLRQILLNLVGNAIKFTQDGAVSVSATVVGEQLRLEVSDTGPGIPADKFPLLFRDFSQLDSSSRRAFGGTGLGLAICKRLAEAMGGTIGVTSEVGVGSTFWVELPVTPVSEIGSQALFEQLETVDTSRPLARSVLVVDDNEINRQVAGGLLRSLGMEVETANDGAIALERMALRRYDLVLMDMQMPVLDGLEATRAIRARGDRTTIIGLTANAFQADRDACVEAGMNDHVAKPVTREKLAKLIGTAEANQTSPAPTPAPDESIDQGQQQAIRAELGEEVFDTLVADFAKDGLRLIIEARWAAEQGDDKRYDAALHTLKGAAVTLGFVTIGALAAGLRGEDRGHPRLDQLYLEVERLAA